MRSYSSNDRGNGRRKDSQIEAKRTAAIQLLSKLSDNRQSGKVMTEVVSLFADVGDRKLLLQLLDQMEISHYTPDNNMIRRILQVGVPDGDVFFHAQVLHRVQKSKEIMTAPIYNTLIQCMYNNLELERIMDTLVEMKKNHITPERPSFESAIRLALRLEDAPTALSIVEEMEKFNMIDNENQNLYLQILRCAAIAEQVDITNYCWEKGVQHLKLSPDNGTLSYILLLSAKLGSPKLGSQVLEQMLESGMQCYEQHLANLLQAFAMSGDLKGAFSMLQIMDSEGILTRKETAMPILYQLGSNVASIERAIQILRDLHSEGKGVHVAGFNSVLYAAAKTKQLDLVKDTFKLVSQIGVKANVDTFNCLLDAGIFCNDWEYGRQAWTSMKSAKLKPNSTSYSKMVVLCTTQEDYEDCFRYLEEMKYFKFKPPRGCYNMLIKKLLKAGDERAHVAIQDMQACGYDIPEDINRLVVEAGSEDIHRAAATE
ncbi:hypothetical protein INT43_007537 [Umbelopsis isabellina]|uniref:Pentatricopeptide repeat-containing protein-mitochondrial domain-containing protein n=1 Tax=Mortierella isabellina TaxID=91625 RepID=A0A8H7PMU0_MORIS|nr:hypothetical protein INT43_007537 [Umbelopsis isabellina]